jgi:hypothetical protein
MDNKDFSSLLFSSRLAKFKGTSHALTACGSSNNGFVLIEKDQIGIPSLNERLRTRRL